MPILTIVASLMKTACPNSQMWSQQNKWQRRLLPARRQRQRARQGQDRLWDFH